MIAVDTETEMIEGLGDKVRTRFHVPDLVCVSWAESISPLGYPQSEVSADETSMKQRLVRWLGSARDLVFHNAAFDVAVLAKAFDLEEEFRDKLRRREILDTRVMYALRRPEGDRSLSLAAAARYVLGETIEKGDVRTSFRRGTPLTAEQKAYARKDAEVTLRLAEALVRQPYGALSPQPAFFRAFQIYAEETGRFDPDREFSAAAAWLAFNIEPIGLAVDRDRLLAYKSQAEAEVNAMLEQLVEDGLARKSRKGEITLHMVALRDAYTAAAERIGLRPAEKGQPPLAGQYPVSAKTENISLEYKFWKEYKDELSPRLRRHLDLGKQRKLLGTYFRPLVERLPLRGQLTVHPNIGVCFAETARWTCWRPNLQNQPKKIRDMYRAPSPGHVLVSSDYKSLEMFTACEAIHRLGLGHGPLRDLLDMGGDLHTNTARLMYQKKDINADERKIAKITNFAMLGGQGARRFMRGAREAGLDWTLTDATKVRDRWFSTFTDAAAFLDLFRVDPWDLCPETYNRRAWLDLNDVPTEPWPSRFDLSRALNAGAIYECRLPSGRVIPNRRFSQAANIFFQGIGAEVISLAFNMICERHQRVCVVVHDSITVEAPAEHADLLGQELVDCMQEAQRQVCSCGVLIPKPEYEIQEYWA